MNYQKGNVIFDEKKFQQFFVLWKRRKIPFAK